MFEISIGILLGVFGFLLLKNIFRDVLEVDKIKKYENAYKIPRKFRKPIKHSHK